MRRIALPLLLALASLAFAPAPFQKAERRDRESPEQKRRRDLAECRRLLDGLGVKWQVVPGPRGDVVRFGVRGASPGGGWSASGERPVRGGDLAATLRAIAGQVRDIAREIGESPQP